MDGERERERDGVRVRVRVRELLLVQEPLRVLTRDPLPREKGTVHVNYP